MNKVEELTLLLDDRAERIAILEGLLKFALRHEDKFTEFDLDGVKKIWIDSVRNALSK
jgi:hypothetical protein